MATCPACGTDVPDGAEACPRCQLGVALFGAVREAAGPGRVNDPTYLRTIGELISTIDLTPSPPPAPVQGLLSRPARFPALPAASPPPPARDSPPVPPLVEFPALPAATNWKELKRRVDDYFQLARRLGLDFTAFETRAAAANLSDDEGSLDAVGREMFVHLASAIAEEFEAAIARRNELAQMVATPSADVELDAVRASISSGDLLGAYRRIVHLRDDLARVEEEWAAGRILVTECDLLVQTIRELGGDPGPAVGPLEEGRRGFAKGQRSEAERLLARAAVALWSVLEPLFFEELKRRRDRLIALRGSGVDIAPALVDLREIAEELRQRNFVGTITAYRRLATFVDRVPATVEPPEGEPLPAPMRPTSSA